MRKHRKLLKGTHLQKKKKKKGIAREMMKVLGVSVHCKESGGKGKRERLIVSCMRGWILRKKKETFIDWGDKSWKGRAAG